MSSLRQERIETKPLEITLIRHAESRANVAQKRGEKGEPLGEFADVLGIHDNKVVLSPDGVAQVARARKTLDALMLNVEYFDARLTATLLRTMQTAAGLSNSDDTEWVPDGKLVERDWGYYGSLSVEEQKAQFPYFDEHWETSKFFARQPHGQSIADVTFQIRAFIARAYAKYAGKRIVAVTSGETIQGFEAVLGKLTPHEWEDRKEAGLLKVRNLDMIQWSRIKPEWYYENESGDDGHRPIVDSFSSGWHRVINLADPDLTSEGRAWTKLDRKSSVTAADMMAVVNKHQPSLQTSV